MSVSPIDATAPFHTLIFQCLLAQVEKNPGDVPARAPSVPYAGAIPAPEQSTTEPLQPAPGSHSHQPEYVDATAPVTSLSVGMRPQSDLNSTSVLPRDAPERPSDDPDAQCGEGRSARPISLTASRSSDPREDPHIIYLPPILPQPAAAGAGTTLSEHEPGGGPPIPTQETTDTLRVSEASAGLRDVTTENAPRFQMDAATAPASELAQKRETEGYTHSLPAMTPRRLNDTAHTGAQASPTILVAADVQLPQQQNGSPTHRRLLVEDDEALRASVVLSPGVRIPESHIGQRLDTVTSLVDGSDWDVEAQRRIASTAGDDDGEV